ncbi:unnamed protein product [Heligmosomoides polygyrus]|uniref:HTH_7 domain-containing protein n=1 Tax=Heligmosomoides polygyrus TaxID=6339 RepID=A0A183F5U0_HELPZ|nr:unnamed protein product [Heligmosomoides polygyrus]
MSRESERITVVELHKTGMRTADIVRTTGFKQRTVYKIVRHYKETGGTSDRPRSGRPTTATTPENINKECVKLLVLKAVCSPSIFCNKDPLEVDSFAIPVVESDENSILRQNVHFIILKCNIQ